MSATTLHYASDLHLEFPENREWLRNNPLQGSGVLLLAGDVMPFGGLDKLREHYVQWGDQFEHVLWVPGNHEYYGGDINQRSGNLDEKLTSNVRLLNDAVWYAPGLRILCTTLWTRIGQLNEAQVMRNMNDYHQIRNGGKLLRPAHTTALHETALAWLTAELEKPFEGATVVVTHHVPTLLHYPPEYVGGDLNEAFAVELHDLIADSNITAWIYGHHHRNIPPYTIGNTQMLTNQLGYVRLGEDAGFDPSKKLALNDLSLPPISTDQ